MQDVYVSHGFHFFVDGSHDISVGYSLLTDAVVSPLFRQGLDDFRVVDVRCDDVNINDRPRTC